MRKLWNVSSVKFRWCDGICFLKTVGARTVEIDATVVLCHLVCVGDGLVAGADANQEEGETS